MEMAVQNWADMQDQFKILGNNQDILKGVIIMEV
jgi:hypothetical protein